MIQMCFPPVGKDYEDLVLSGYHAVITWDGTYKSKVRTRFANFTVLTMLWPIKFLEIIISFAEDIFMFLWQVVKGLCVRLVKNILRDVLRNVLRNVGRIFSVSAPLIVVLVLMVLPFPSHSPLSLIFPVSAVA